MAAEWVPRLQTRRGTHARHRAGDPDGLRRCRSEAAFQELLFAAQRHRVPISAMAWGLVHLTCGGDRSPETGNAAQSAARHEWGQLLAEPVVLPC